MSIHNVVAAASASVVVLLFNFAALAGGQRTDAAIQDTATAPKVLLAQATQQESPPFQPGREAQSGASVGDKPALSAGPTASTKQPSVMNQLSVDKQKEEAQKLGQEVK